MLIVCDSAHARNWIDSKRNLCPENSIILHNTKRGLFEPSPSAEFKSGIISQWSLVKPNITVVLTDIAGKVLVNSHGQEFFDLPKTISYLFQVRKFSEIALVSYSDALSVLQLYITITQFGLPSTTKLHARSVGNDSSTLESKLFSTAEFENTVKRLYTNFYASKYLQSIIRSSLKTYNNPTVLSKLFLITPMALFILHLINNEPGIRAVFVGRNILDAIGVDGFSETSLRSAEIQFAIDGLLKCKFLSQTKSALFVTNEGWEFLRSFDSNLIHSLATQLLRPTDTRFQVIDAIMLKIKTNLDMSLKD